MKKFQDYVFQSSNDAQVFAGPYFNCLATTPVIRF